ncbi:MAG TPA: chromate efflux transporter [Polyangiaceae bacterium]
MTTAPPPHPAPHVTLPALVRTSLYYGLVGFGGGYSVLAQLRRDLVEVRKWLDAEQFLVLAELSKSLPGTPATTLLALLGQRVAGLRGGVAAAASFLLPSFVLMTACGAAYTEMRQLSGLSIFFDGMNAAMVGIVGSVTVDLGRAALRSRLSIAVAVACGAILAARLVSEPVLAAAAVAFGVVRAAWTPSRKDGDEPPKPPPGSQRLHAAAPLVAVLGLGSFAAVAALVRVFVPIGVMTFGGGLAMIPAIEHVVVIEQHWLDAKTFADAIALGQVTPGPVAICATFIGYRVAGVAGAFAATLAMFGPATAVALAAGRSVERFRASPLVQGALQALAPAVIGMLGAATFSLGRSVGGSLLDVVLAAVAFLLLVLRPVSPLWVLLAGGVVRLGASHFLR